MTPEDRIHAKASALVTEWMDTERYLVPLTEAIAAALRDARRAALEEAAQVADEVKPFYIGERAEDELYMRRRCAAALRQRAEA